MYKFYISILFFLSWISTANAALTLIEKKYIKDYKLNDKALITLLDTTFALDKDPNVAFRNQGWKILKEDFDTIVVEHEKFPKYVVKVVPTAQCNWLNLFLNSRNIERLIFLDEIKEYVTNNKLDFIVLPQKWIYEIPGTQIHAIIATKIDILPTPVNKQRLKTFFTQAQKEEMYKLINSVVFWDGHNENLYITKDKKLAIIDTARRISSRINVLDFILKGIFRKRGRDCFYKALHS